MISWMIRPEQPGDEPAIHTLVKRAFVGRPFSEGDEQDLVDALRDQGDLVLSLVAVDLAGTIVGHIGFSPSTIEQQYCDWFQMAPVSVAPEVQGQGIGSDLIQTGIAEMRRRGARGVAVLGDPGYYERFGFSVIPGLVALADQDRPYLRFMVLSGPVPQGTLRYAPAFG